MEKITKMKWRWASNIARYEGKNSGRQLVDEIGEKQRKMETVRRDLHSKMDG